MGLAISAYEWMAAATLIIVAVFFIPVYLKHKIYTMPQFLSQRYNGKVAMIRMLFVFILCIAGMFVIRNKDNRIKILLIVTPKQLPASFLPVKSLL